MSTMALSYAGNSAEHVSHGTRDFLPAYYSGSSVRGPDAERIYQTLNEITKQLHASTKASENSTEQTLLTTLQVLRAQPATSRGPAIAARLETLSRDAEEEGETIRAASLGQFRSFFEAHTDLGMPKITLTPDGTLRTRWLDGQGHFFAIEFTGRAMAKIAAEVPRPHGQNAAHYATEPLNQIMSFAQSIGAVLA